MGEPLSALLGWWVAIAPDLIGPVYPFVNAAHILSLALLVGCIVTLDLRLLGAFSATPPAALARPLSRVAVTGLSLAVLTGVLLFSVQPGHYLANAAFLAKLAIVAAGVLNAIFLRSRPGWQRMLAGERITAPLRVSATLSLLIWVSAVLAGRWIAFL